MGSLGETLSAFAEQCNHNERLREMNRDWSRTVAIVPEEGGELHWIRCEGGCLSVGEGPVEQPDLEVSAPRSILDAVFSGNLAPTDPYNSGDLMVRGSQDDLMRLDIITLLLWGE